MSKFGKETKDKISPLLAFINNAPPPLALKVCKDLFSSSSIMCCILVSSVSFTGLLRSFLFLSSLSKNFSTPEIP